MGVKAGWLYVFIKCYIAFTQSRYLASLKPIDWLGRIKFIAQHEQVLIWIKSVIQP